MLRRSSGGMAAGEPGEAPGPRPGILGAGGGATLMAQSRVLSMLAGRGIVAAGTPLEVVPEALPADSASHDPRAFRARVADPASPRRSLVWELDGRPYSPTELTCKLRREYGVAALGPSYYSHWRVVGRGSSLWEESRALAGEGDDP
jgi:hypothetical protein